MCFKVNGYVYCVATGCKSLSNLSSIDKTKPIGLGSTGYVFSGNLDGERIVVKIIPLDALIPGIVSKGCKTQDGPQTKREVKALQELPRSPLRRKKVVTAKRRKKVVTAKRKKKEVDEDELYPLQLELGFLFPANYKFERGRLLYDALARDFQWPDGRWDVEAMKRNIEEGRRPIEQMNSWERNCNKVRTAQFKTELANFEFASAQGISPKLYASGICTIKSTVNLPPPFIPKTIGVIVSARIDMTLIGYLQRYWPNDLLPPCLRASVQKLVDLMGKCKFYDPDLHSENLGLVVSENGHVERAYDIDVGLAQTNAVTKQSIEDIWDHRLFEDKNEIRATLRL